MNKKLFRLFCTVEINETLKVKKVLMERKKDFLSLMLFKT